VDEGLFGPDSVTRRVVGHQAAIVGGLRSLVIQSLHPLAMAGVAAFSDYRARPLHRLRGTARYVAATTFGSVAEAERAAARVRRVHRRVRGTDPVTGRPYSAEDPGTQVWVHTVEVHSFLTAYRAYGGAVSEEEADRFFAENVRVAALLGTPPELVPASAAEVRAYFARVRPQLCVSDAARDAIDFILHPPLQDRDLLALQLPLRAWPARRSPSCRATCAASPASTSRGPWTPAIAAMRPVVAALHLPGVRRGYEGVLGTGGAARAA
jgi:uncharacterized protein (DUF2236 family)